MQRKPVTWAVGDEVSFSASPTCAANRTVYTGRIESIEGNVADVREYGWQAVCAVRLDRLHRSGAYEILDSGPVGIRWTDRK
jgi:hypothetical protein